MNKDIKILISSTQYPYYGGSATNAYALIKEFRKNGYDTQGLFIDSSNNNIDPDKIGKVYRIKNHLDLNKISIILKNFGREPDIIFAKNYVAPVVCKSIFPNSKVVYLSGGCPQMMDLSLKKISSVKYLSSNDSFVFEKEKKCIEKSDFIIPNSNIGKKLLIKHYGNILKIKEPINTSFVSNFEIFNKVNFLTKKIDIIFIASNLERSVKNSELAKEIFINFENNKKVVVGNNSNIFSGIKNTILYPYLNNKNVIKLLLDSKVSLCTSYYDASPNIIRESLNSGCNILTSKNCGWSELYPEEFICEDVYDVKEWIFKCKKLINKKIDFNYLKSENITQLLIGTL